MSILKPPPTQVKSSRRATTGDGADDDNSQENDNGAANHTSPVNKRKGFSGKKWLPQQLRKLSHSKADKLGVDKPIVKKDNKKIKDKQKEEVESSAAAASSLSTATTASLSNSLQQSEIEPDDEVALELPPPMKPLQDNVSATLPSTATTIVNEENGAPLASCPPNMKSLDETPSVDLSEIEQIVKEKMEKHSLQNPIMSPPCSENEDNYGNESVSIDDILKKREYVLDELVKTEEAYVQDLSLIVNGYIAEIRNPNSDIPMPEDLKGGKERMVFGNIEAIYEWHRDIFLKSLQNCVQNPCELSAVINRNRAKLRMYVVYCQNKPVSEHIVQEHFSYFEEIKKKLEHKLLLCDLLIKPVQRIMKYELLLKDILKHTKRAGETYGEEARDLEMALNIMKEVPKACNEMMDVGRLQKFEGKITAQGNLLLYGTLLCVECLSGDRNSSMQKPKELRVFLFEQNIIFSDIVGRKTQFTNPSYIYKSHVQVNKMTVQELNDQNGKRFLVCSTDPQRSDVSFICQAPTLELHTEWIQTLSHMLQKQKEFIQAITNPKDYIRRMGEARNNS
jgi:triple functional domain protein